MGKMKIRINCQINLSDEYENEPEKLQEEIDFILNKFGEVEEFTKEQDESTLTLKSQLKAHELQVNLFEKWGEWEYARSLSRDMRMNFIEFGEVEECNSGVFDYEATKKTFKNPLKSLLFFDK
jgi:vacuolar-type H+-ATPase subunit I/STV1